jgi:subtilisin family serine protease
VAGTEALTLISPYFGVPSLNFTDKISGGAVTLTADPNRIMVPKSDSESAKTVQVALKLKPLFPKAHLATYDVFNLPDTEDATDVIGKIEQSQHIKVIPAYRDQKSGTRFLHPQLCVVQFVEGMTQAAEMAWIGRLGLVVKQQHRTPGLYTLEVPAAETNPSALADTINELNKRPEVRFAEPNFLGFDDIENNGGTAVIAGTTTEGAQLSWNLTLVHAPAAWRTTVGSPDVLIAVIDTGVQKDHPCLQGGLLLPDAGETWNFVNPGNPMPDDDEGHGTFISGLLVGNGEKGLRGFCRNCRVLPIKVPLAGEEGSYAGRRDGILFALSKVKRGQRLILNVSWKTTGDIGLIRDAIATAIASGAIVIASAGNFPDSPNEPHFPSDYPGVISVASVGPDSRRASYSYFGDSVALSAPGGASDQSGGAIQSAGLNSTLTTDYGTSFAAPHVAGAVALILSANRTLAASNVRAALCDTASPLTDTGMGKGLLDFGRALAQAVTQAGDAPPAAGTTSSFGLQLVNSATADVLVARFGLLSFTASLLVANRPFAKLDDIRQTLGLTDSQFSTIAGAVS